MSDYAPPNEGVTTPPIFYVEPDANGDPTIWRTRPAHWSGDRAVLVRTSVNADDFDALGALIGKRGE